MNLFCALLTPHKISINMYSIVLSFRAPLILSKTQVHLVGM
jgi:hypothetical protein